MSIIQLLPHDVRRALFAIAKNSEFARMQGMRINARGEYSYKPFDDTESIFVHIPKAAGVSVCRSLYGNLAGEHASIAWYQYVFSKKDFNRYYKFTFVRNPWDRLFSAYSFLAKGGFNKQDEDWARENLSQFASFEQFVMEWVKVENVNKYVHFVPQTNLLYSRGTSTISVDFVGYFENLENDFNHVAKIINKNILLPHLNKTDQNLSGYMNEYNDAMMSVVGRVYKADIETFGYVFDNSTIGHQIALRTAG